MAQYSSSDTSENGDDFQIRKKNINKSVAWEHFEVQDEQKRLASCNLCANVYSYRTTVTNLVKHLKRKHNVYTENTPEVENDEDHSENEKEETVLEMLLTKSDMRSKIQSPIWSYFKIKDPVVRVAVCLICNKSLSYASTQTNLRRHLARKHPHAITDDGEKKRILFSTGEQLYELKTTPKGEHDDDENEMQTDVEEVYFEDLEESIKPKIEDLISKSDIKKRKKRKCIINTRNCGNSSAEEQFQANREKCDSLNYFGKYLISLLKQLPKHLSNQLQTDFIKQVMNAQLTYETNSAIKAAKGTSKTEAVPEPATEEELVGFIEVDTLDLEHGND